MGSSGHRLVLVHLSRCVHFPHAWPDRRWSPHWHPGWLLHCRCYRQAPSRSCRLADRRTQEQDDQLTFLMKPLGFLPLLTPSRMSERCFFFLVHHMTVFL